jgi:hypothetical protein
MSDTIKNYNDAMSASFPKVTFNKNGYEIRTQVLEMAKEQEWNDFHAKLQAWEQTVVRDPDTSEVISTTLLPSVPGVSAILETAEEFYNFINKK